MKPIYIGNAGLVLFAPYLPQLFEQLTLLSADEGGRRCIRGADDASRAVHLLQYLADERLDAPDAGLALNKLLCGLAPEQPISSSLDARPGDLELCDGLILAVIADWPIIANTSSAGLRETFLMRGGRLGHEEDRWILTVERKVLDVLTDQLPWSIATISHRWMPEPIHVRW